MFGNVYKGKKVLVTGNTGFKGAWLTEWLLMLEAEVTGFSIDIPTTPSLFEVNHISDRINFIQGDIKDSQNLIEQVKVLKPDFVFHLAAQPIVKRSYENPIETFSTNVLGTANILEALRLSNHPCCAVIITSDKCYENVEWTWGYRENDRLGGKDPYSASKGAAELIIHSYLHSYFNKPDSKIKLASVRAGNVIGGGDWAPNRIVPDCMRSWAAGSAVEIRSPKSTRPWQHVLEPLSGYLRVGQLLAEKSQICGEAYNFGPLAEQSKTVLELLESLSEFWEFAHDQGKFTVHQDSNFHEAGLLKLNCDKALHDLNWSSTLNFEQTTNLTGIWYRNYYQSQQESMAIITSNQINEYVTIAESLRKEWVK